MYRLYWPNILFEISRSFLHSSMRGYWFRLMTDLSLFLSQACWRCIENLFVMKCRSKVWAAETSVIFVEINERRFVVTCQTILYEVLERKPVRYWNSWSQAHVWSNDRLYPLGAVCLTCGTRMLEFLSRRVKWCKQTACGEPWRGTGFKLPSVSQVLGWASLRPNSPLIRGR